MKPRSLLIGATVPLRPCTSTAEERTRLRPSSRPRSLRAGANPARRSDIDGDDSRDEIHALLQRPVTSFIGRNASFCPHGNNKRASEVCARWLTSSHGRAKLTARLVELRCACTQARECTRAALRLPTHWTLQSTG
eukprot:scaffold85110_cov47-Phaeocystis_antarctica.AAC.2